MKFLLNYVAAVAAIATAAAQPYKLPLECNEEHFVRAGLSCGESRPCPVFLEWIASAATDEAVFLAGATFTRESTLASAFVASFDGGKNWQEVFSRIGAASIEFVQFADKDHGWAAGQQLDQNGSFLPFVLLTTDGGKQWRKKNLWDPSEFRSGLLLDMSFRNAEIGELVVERGASAVDPYERFETRNGGRVWSLRGITTTRPRLRAPVPDPAGARWRIAKSDSGEYAIEKQDDSGWSVVETFASDLGECADVEATQEFDPDRRD